MRTKNAIINMLSGVIGQIVTLILSFITRTVFINQLSVEYLGLNGLFSNILTLFSLANLGIGTAITFSLYKPIAEHDNNKVIYLSKLLQKSYYVIGSIILILGLCVIPFLDIIVKTDSEIPNLVLIYVIYLINYAFPYFYGYSFRSVATAHQKEYLYLTTNTVAVIVTDLLRILLLILTQNYIIYILISTIINIVTFIILKFRLFNKYPYLNNKTNYRINENEKKEIIRNIKGTFLYNFGFVITNGTDNILMSTFIGIKYLGYLSNYQYIIGAIQSILRQIFVSLIASIGDLNASSDIEKKKSIFNVLLFSNFWFYGFSAISLFVLSDPFFKLWVGSEYIVDKTLVLILVINFFLKGMQNASNSYRSAMGLFWQGRFRPALSSIINLIVSLILVQFLGATGIFLGTLISIIFVDLWYEPIIVFKHGFKSPPKQYFFKFGVYLFTTIIVGTIVYLFSLMLDYGGIVSFIYLVLLCSILPNILFIIIFYNTEEFKYLKNVLKGLVLRKLKNRI